MTSPETKFTIPDVFLFGSNGLSQDKRPERMLLRRKVRIPALRPTKMWSCLAAVFVQACLPLARHCVRLHIEGWLCLPRSSPIVAKYFWLNAAGWSKQGCCTRGLPAICRSIVLLQNGTVRLHISQSTTSYGLPSTSTQNA